jgi:polyisoprenoid-binding protein YceI
MQATQLLAGTWKLDPARTLVEFSAKHRMFTTVRGRFGEVEGEFTVDAENPSASFAQVRIAAATLDTGQSQRDEHLRSADFFDVDQHPYISFASRRIEGDPMQEGERFRVIGDLTMRGETKEVVLEAEFRGAGVNPWGQTVAGFTAEGKLDRREFGLNWNQALETGGILVSNEIRIHVEAQASPEASQ